MALPKLNGFEFERLLGEGAFGQVWLARDVKLGVRRAVKLVNRQTFTEDGARRLAAEARTLAALPAHPNRVGVHILFDNLLGSFVVMDYVAGGALSGHTAADKPMDWARAARYIAAVGGGLEAVHAAGLVHRDIKPDNLLLDPARDEAVLGDFGIAAAAGGRGGAVGTHGYIPPEGYTGAGADPAADVYALAASLLHLATGRPPARQTPADGQQGWATLPAELQPVVAAGLAPLPTRDDLPTFVARVREARWAAVVAGVGRAPAGLRVTVGVAAGGGYAPLPAGGAATGEVVKVEAVADAPGYHTLLTLGSSGAVGVAVPRPTDPARRFAAGEPCGVLLALTPPAGTERVVAVWTRQPVSRTDGEWQAWLEAHARRKGVVTRGLEVVGTPPAAVAGDWRATVVSIPHAPGG